jgi:hypothetical protein
MGGGIAHKVRLGFDNPTTQAPFTVFADEVFANEESSERNCFNRQFRPAQPAQPNLCLPQHPLHGPK